MSPSASSSVSGQSPFSVRHLLLPYDFSAQGDRLIEQTYGYYHTAFPETRITVLHVLATLSSNDPCVLWQTLTPQERCQTVSQKFWHHFAPLLPPPSQSEHNVQFIVVIGEPEKEIIKQAKTLPADLIMLPSHGRQGISRLLLGSVAEAVVRRAHCPVLVVK